MQTSQVNNKIGNEEFEKNLAGQLWFKYFPYWPLFLLLFVLCIGGAWYYLKHTTPLYESTATILIKDEKKGMDDSKMIESLNQLSTKKIIENEIEVIHSRALMNEVVKTLHLYAPVYERGDKKPVSAYATSPIIIESDNPNALTPVDKVFFHYSKDSAKVFINGKSYSLNTWNNTPYGTLKFIPQVANGTPQEPLFFSLVNPKGITADLVSKLNASSASKQSSVINLKIRDEVPKRSEDVLNTLVFSYNNAALRDKNVLAANTLAFVDERLAVVSHDLDSIEHKLQQYKAEKGATDISSQSQMFLQNVSTNDQKLGDVNMKLAVLNKVENYVKSRDNSEGIVPSTVGVDDPLLTQMLNTLYEQTLQYEKLRKTTGEKNPLLVSVSDQINKIKPNILENISNQRQNLEASKTDLNSTNNQYSSMLNTIPQKERDLVEISRQQTIKSGIYNYLLQKREETALSNIATVTDSRIIDKAESSFGPVSPDKMKVYALAVILAIAIGIGLVTVNELINRTILFRHEIESRTSSPIIGEILHEKAKTQLVLGDGQRTFIAEQFRKLRTSLAYIGIHGDRKKLLVTSTVPGDGKSFIVANLGLSLAMAGKRVIVLEFDLSDPTLSDKLGVISNKGLSNYLMGEISDVDEIIHPTDVHENLFIIPSGPLPDNPSDLIVSEKVEELMQHISPQFDYVIVDTAPVGLLSDAYVLSSYCDGTLYVIRHRHTPKLAIERIDENNQINELKNMGIVFNDVRSRGFGKNGYGYGYGYGYIHKAKKGKRKRGIKKIA